MFSPLFWLSVVVFIRFILIAAVILTGPFSLSPDEAQYWTWSQDLSLGYYSKPPGIAWQIWLTTFLFGNTEWGVRSSALILGTIMPFAIYLLARSAELSKKVAALSGITFALIPIGVVGSMLAITDGGMLLFWTLSCAYFLHTSIQDKALNPWIMGGLIALGALFKWPIYILLGLLLLWSLLFETKYLKSLMFTGLVSMIGLLPSLLWNIEHDFVTFKHVASSLGVGGADQAQAANPNFVEFFAAQFGLMSPLLFIFFWIALYRLVKEYDPPTKASMFLFFISASLLIPMGLAFFSKVQANWGDFFYPTAVVFTVDYLFNKMKRGSFWWGLSMALSILLLSTLFTLSYLDKIPFKSNPFKNTLGWRSIYNQLQQAGFDKKEDFLVADSYQNAALLSFYSPSQVRAYFLNLKNRRLNQFSFWPSLKEDKRAKGFYYFSEEAKKMKKEAVAKEIELVSPYFESVTPLKAYPLYENETEPVRLGFLFKVSNYFGKEPKTSRLY